MLTALSIRDVVLIERLDLAFGIGLTVLTGETGAGKSILLDSLGLALGARADGGLVRAGAGQASVTASFAPPAGHPLSGLLAEQGLETEDEVVLRRVLGKDGRSRAFINDQPVGVALLRRAAGLLVEVQGQHEQIGLADPTSHAGLLDAFGVARPLREATAAAWRAWRDAIAALEAAQAAIAEAERDEAWLRHAVDELAGLAPQENEEERLARERQRLQQGERRAEAIAAAIAELTPRDRRSPAPAAALRAAGRALQRLVTPAQPDAVNPAEPALAALERAEEALAEAETILTRLASEADADPRQLEQAVDAAREAYVQAATALGAARRTAAARLDRAVSKELPPLRLDKARFHPEVAALTEANWGPSGHDAVRFLIATNPGQELGPLG